MTNAQEVATRSLWRSADAVCFDVDSTVCRDEAIDELAKFAGVERQVTEMTRLAMGGSCTFREALAERLQLIKPSQDMAKRFLEANPPRLTPGIKELVALLKKHNVQVFLVSGGFDFIIEPVAKELEISMENVFANKLKFHADGSYAGFDEEAPTSHQNGKAKVIAYLKDKFGYRKVVMVGDGATDMGACPPAEAFIGFGGNQVRETVKDQSKWFVTSFYDLIEEFNKK